MRCPLLTQTGDLRSMLLTTSGPPISGVTMACPEPSHGVLCASSENWRRIVQRIAGACSAILVSAGLAAQAQTPSPGSPGFEKKNYNYSEWTKGLFSEVVTVTHPG